MPLTKKQNERKRMSLNNIEGIKDMILKNQVEVIRSNPIALSSSLIGKKHNGVVERGRVVRAKHASREPYRHMVSLIARELTMTFGKTDEQAWKLLKKVRIGSLLAKHPLSLHESPQNWAVGILTKAKEWDTLDRYYSQ